MQLPGTLGELRESGYQRVSVKDELRANLIRKLRAGERLFPGIVGYDETVIPQLVNAILSRHNLILGDCAAGKERIIRQLTGTSRRADTGHRGLRSERRSLPARVGLWPRDRSSWTGTDTTRMD